MLQPRQVLEQLLATAQRRRGRSSAPVSITLRGKRFAAYRNLALLQEKKEFDALMRAAASGGCLEIGWDSRGGEDAFIARITLIDAAGLAAFLQVPLHSDVCDFAQKQLDPWLADFPKLNDWLQRWRNLEAIRGYGPGEVAAVLDAAYLVKYVRANDRQEHVVRVLSARLFGRSKRIEEVVPLIDALTSEKPGRSADDVLAELGIRREPQPALLAGAITVARTYQTTPLDRPYHGVAPESVVSIVDQPQAVLTIENKTTFHLVANTECAIPVLILYSGGMPSPVWRAMYRRLLAQIGKGTPILHWGDIDEGGFRIARVIAREAAAEGRILKPWLMNSAKLDGRAMMESASEAAVERAATIAQEIGWSAEALGLRTAKRFIEQELLDVELPWRQLASS